MDYKIEYDIPAIINKLNDMMIPFRIFKKINKINQDIFYRGDIFTIFKMKSYNKKSFISVTMLLENAIPYKEENGIIYNISIDNNVKVLSTGIENELLIEPNSFWEYIKTENNNIFIHISKYNPNAKDFNLLLDENLELNKKQIIDIIDDFNMLELDYNILDFEIELKLFNIIYNPKDIDKLFYHYILNR